MPKLVKSAKGETLDFDLLKIKEEIAAAPSPIEVRERKQFIENKLNRRINRAKAELKKSVEPVEEKAPIALKELDEQPKIRTIKKKTDDTSTEE